MAQGEFTKEEGKDTQIAVNEMFDAIPKKKQELFIGHLNDTILFINASIKNAPSIENT